MFKNTEEATEMAATAILTEVAALAVELAPLGVHGGDSVARCEASTDSGNRSPLDSGPPVIPGACGTHGGLTLGDSALTEGVSDAGQGESPYDEAVCDAQVGRDGSRLRRCRCGC